MLICNSPLHACGEMIITGSSTHTYRAIPKLQRPENNSLVLLTWGTMVSDHQVEVLSEWANSEDGWNLYKQLARDVQNLQDAEQFTFTMAA